MLLLRTVAPWMLLVFLGHQVSLCCGARHKNRGADKAATTAPDKVHVSGDKPAASGRGKFLAVDNMLCSWGTKDVGDTVRLSVKCKDRRTRVKGAAADLECQYNAKPQSCPGYRSDTRGFWKQVARALKRLQGKVCKDGRALVRAGMCKRAPRDAHFKLAVRATVAPAVLAEPEDDREPLPTRAASAGPTACSARADHRETAEEKCGSSWASVCNFLLSMLQRDEC
ncbi:fibroblast growth factor-binding protein 1-like [Pungitius pungitius]|uniref:fibroblast growth factor-binding protein 1-like n=1 Tax=Pungitius pungitius TaxID=134920 RepID=UPI001887778C|nr:fibroblast growth factor-binding protein 1-like [Pungitius pungitius]